MSAPGVDGGRPAVSVVIPAYNAQAFLTQSIPSVLAQTWPDLECIVVDDGSTDDTAAIVRSFDDDRLRYVWKENRGTVSDARNFGIEAARGEWIAFLDADDVWLPEKLARQLALAAPQADVSLVYSAYAIADPSLRILTVVWPDHDDPTFRKWLLLEGNGIAPSSTALIRRAALDRSGGYRLELSVSEDIDLAERLATQGRVVAVDECLALYRTHPGQNHKSLEKFSHDRRWIFDQRFGVGGVDDPESWRRGMANLATRLFFYEIRSGRPLHALRYLDEVRRTKPSRLLALPAEAVMRRTRRRTQLRRYQGGISAEVRRAQGLWNAVPRHGSDPDRASHG